jgi:predicted DNA-binding transcriptional regulator AlpA
MALIIEPKTVTLHATDDPDELTFTYHWEDIGEPLPWGMDVNVLVCDCVPNPTSPDVLDRAFNKIRNAIQPALDAYRFDQIKNGATTVDRDRVCELLGRENTWLDERIKEGRFPRALYIGNKRVWLEDEVQLAKARIIAEDSAAAAKRTASSRHRPLNRHERRKAAACAGRSRAAL